MGTGSLFWSPRAAAAQDNKVDRLARNAASWSTDTPGASTLYGVCDLDRAVCRSAVGGAEEEEALGLETEAREDGI